MSCGNKIVSLFHPHKKLILRNLRNISHYNVHLKTFIECIRIIKSSKNEYKVRYFVRNKNSFIAYLKLNLNNNKRRNIIYLTETSRL